MEQDLLNSFEKLLDEKLQPIQKKLDDIENDIKKITERQDVLCNATKTIFEQTYLANSSKVIGTDHTELLKTLEEVIKQNVYDIAYLKTKIKK